MVDRSGIPLACRVSAANIHDVTMLLVTVVGCPLGNYGEKNCLPRRLYADRAYGSAGHDGVLRWMRLEPISTQRQMSVRKCQSQVLYVGERSNATLDQNLCLNVRYYLHGELHQASLNRAGIKIRRLLLYAAEQIDFHHTVFAMIV